MRTKLGSPKAIVAAAHKLARLVYHLLKYRVPFTHVSSEQADTQHRERLLKQLQRQAQRLGAKLVFETLTETEVS